MDPFVVWVTVAIGGLASFTALMVKRFLDHLESDLAYSRKSASRGADTAERATTKAEERV